MPFTGSGSQLDIDARILAVLRERHPGDHVAIERESIKYIAFQARQKAISAAVWEARGDHRRRINQLKRFDEQLHAECDHPARVYLKDAPPMTGCYTCLACGAFLAKHEGNEPYGSSTSRLS